MPDSDAESDGLWRVYICSFIAFQTMENREIINKNNNINNRNTPSRSPKNQRFKAETGNFID